MEVGEEGDYNYTYHNTVTTRMTLCTKMGSNERHCNVLLIVRNKPQTTTFEENGDPKRIRTQALLLTSITPYR